MLRCGKRGGVVDACSRSWEKMALVHAALTSDRRCPIESRNVPL